MGIFFKRSSASVWWCDYVDRDGQRIRISTKMKDKQQAAKVLSKLENEQRELEMGIRAENKGNELLKVHLKRFDTAKASAGKSDQHLTRTSQLIRNLAAYNEWETLGQITSVGIQNYAEHLRKESEQASRLIASMITAIRSFCRWLVRNKILLADPTSTVEKPSCKTDRRIERRMLLPDEWIWLKKSLETESIKNGQDSDERLVMYQLAIETGLRSSELRSLK